MARTTASRTKLKGIYVPVITPFNEDETINFDDIKARTKFLAVGSF